MYTRRNTSVFRWIIVGVLVAQIIVFMLPYASASSSASFALYSSSQGGYTMLGELMNYSVIGALILFCFYILFAVAAGVLLAIRENIVTYTIVTFVSFYTMLFDFILIASISLAAGRMVGPGIGLILNTLFIVAAMVFSIIQMVQFKSTISSAFRQGKTDFSHMQHRFQGYAQPGGDYQPYQNYGQQGQYYGQQPQNYNQPYQNSAQQNQAGGQFSQNPGQQPNVMGRSMKKCPTCGSEYPVDFKFCVKCGKPI